MEPDNELFDAACDLLLAAQRLERASAAEGIDAAVPASAGCLEAALGALRRSVERWEDGAPRARAVALGELAAAVRRAEEACDAARGAGGRPASSTR